MSTPLPNIVTAQFVCFHVYPNLSKNLCPHFLLGAFLKQHFITNCLDKAPPHESTKMAALRSTRSLDEKKKVSSASHDDGVEQIAPELERDEEEEEEDEIDEEDAETRCICGNVDPPDDDGLFIQCEKCQVWQHGYCVSISDDVPEKYWCEKCRPDLHTIIVTSDGKMSKYLPVMKNHNQSSISSKRSRKRPTSGASGNGDESEESQKRRKERATLNSRVDARYEALIQRVMEESKKEAGQTEEKSEDEKSGSNIGRHSRSSRRRGGSSNNDNDENNDTPNTENLEDETSKVTGSDKDRRRKEKNSDGNDSTATGNTTATSSKGRQNGKRSRKIGPKTIKDNSNNKDLTTSIDFNKPTKPRLPQQRSTMNEMRKRVAAILEFIGRTQIDIANEQMDEEELTEFVEDEKSRENITNLFQNYNGSLELMDGLTRKLLIWEQKFGKFVEK